MLGKSIRIKLYRKSEILGKVGLSAECWTALGIISGNDYSSNSFGFGIAKNTKILMNLTGSIAEIILDYCSKIKCSTSQFDNAFKIFSTRKESFLEQGEMTSSSRLSEDKVKEIWGSWNSFVDERSRDRKADRVTRNTIIEYNNLQNKKFNQFRYSLFFYNIRTVTKNGKYLSKEIKKIGSKSITAIPELSVLKLKVKSKKQPKEELDNSEKAKYVSAGRSARDASNVKDKGAKRKNTLETTSN
jgi:hypothetical protein